MKTWRKSIRKNEYDFRNDLAYLENMREVYSFKQGKTYFWAQVGVARPKIVKPADEELLQQLLPDDDQPSVPLVRVG